MPIYEYRCSKCGKVSEFLEGVGWSEEERQCKYCGSKELERIPSVSHILDGSNIIGSHSGKTCCGRDERC